MPVSSTLRLQLHPGFTLDDAGRHVPYYARLGVSHLYLSPVTCARTGSLHGYDVIDHRHVDPELGGEQALERLAGNARSHGMGLILDIVPNHMAAHPDNPWWYSVLQEGPASRFARWFDIQWDAAQPWLRGKVLLPMLAEPYGAALKRGDIRFVSKGAGYAVDVHGVHLPLAANSFDPHDDVDAQARLALHDSSTREGRQRLHALLQRQHYRLAWWQCAADQINWRRFFEISDLAGLCVERDDVFSAVHELPLRLFEQGLIDGLRIDHVDGLAMPLRYCRRLYRALCEKMLNRPAGRRTADPWLIVEKILAPGEYLDSRWAAHGTTGYDFMDVVSAVLHDPEGEMPLTRHWNDIARDTRQVEDWRRDARALMVHCHFSAERDALLDMLCQLTQLSPATRDATRHSLGRALDQVLIEFPVYRTYATLDSRSDSDVRYLKHAWDQARMCLLERRDLTAVRALDFFMRWLTGRVRDMAAAASDDPALQFGKRARFADVIRRFQQLTPPLAAKSLEDTVFYRYGRLVSRNEVGSDPGMFSLSSRDFHHWNQRRAGKASRSMNATATHDHKRGEDVRARLAVLSEVPLAWKDVSTRCLAALGQQETLDDGAQGAQCYMLLQTIAGAWPPDLRLDDEAGMALFIQRLQQWQFKALREAKQMTSWFCPDASHEQEQADRIEYLLCDSGSETCRSIAGFVDAIAPAGALNSLGTVVLRCTLPGVPDTYQGTELWDFSLVDPDNRRDVDMAKREAMLDELQDDGVMMPELLSRWRDGAVKQAVLARCLNLRRQQPALFARGSYEPLPVRGPLAAHVLAFMRRIDDRCMMVLVSRLAYRAIRQGGQLLELPLILPDFWRDTRAILPVNCGTQRWHDVLTGQARDTADGSIPVACALGSLPVAVLVTP